MKAYKITGKDLRSLTVSNSPGGVQYKVNQATVPKTSCGPLAAFKNLGNIREFKRCHGWESAPVFECEVERDKIAKGLLYYSRQGKVESFSELPEGTILCKKIILRGQIE